MKDADATATLEVGLCVSGYSNVVFSDGFEYVQQMSDPEELPNGLSNVDQLQRAARRLAMDISSDQGTQPRAVHVRQLGKIQHDAPRRRRQLAYMVIELISNTVHETAAASHDSGVILVLDDDSQGFRSCVFRHCNLLTFIDLGRSFSR